MKTFARLDENNKIINIEIADDEWIASQPDPSIFIESVEGNKADVGGDYFDGYFYPYNSYASWTRDGQGKWVPPVAKPSDSPMFAWNENTLSWDTLTN